MSLSDSAVKEEVESWRGFAEALRAEDKVDFEEMMNLCYQYAPAMNARDSPFVTESLFMSLILLQHKTIIRMVDEIKKLESKVARVDT